MAELDAEVSALQAVTGVLEKLDPEARLRVLLYLADRYGLALARSIGARGGRARAEALTPERRKEIAEEAAKVRWAKKEAKGREPQ